MRRSLPSQSRGSAIIPGVILTVLLRSGFPGTPVYSLLRAEVCPHLNSSPKRQLHEDHFCWESQFQSACESSLMFLEKGGTLGPSGEQNRCTMAAVFAVKKEISN